MTKFKKGDVVFVVKAIGVDTHMIEDYVGETGVVVDRYSHDPHPYEVRFDNGEQFCFSARELMLAGSRETVKEYKVLAKIKKLYAKNTFAFQQGWHV